jgi:AraC-like DNA-binding protein
MKFQTFPPSDILKPYIKYYWLCDAEDDVAMEIMYPPGTIELCIDLSLGNTVRSFGSRSVRMPCLEVLGHFTNPTRATIQKGTTVLVVRFYPHASSLFLRNQVSDFTNDSIDLYDVLRNEATELYDRLMEQDSLEQKIQVVNTFLIKRLMSNEKKLKSIELVEHICKHIFHNSESLNVEKLSKNYGFSERYIQRLFLERVGLTPKKLFTVQRFNKSLNLILSSNDSLTSIAYECGYYDQAHFIKEFKSFTGVTPSSANILIGENGPAFLNSQGSK